MTYEAATEWVSPHFYKGAPEPSGVVWILNPHTQTATVTVSFYDVSLGGKIDESKQSVSPHTSTGFVTANGGDMWVRVESDLSVFPSGEYRFNDNSAEYMPMTFYRAEIESRPIVTPGTL